MVRVEFLGPIGKEAMEVEAKDLRELAQILKADEQLRGWLKECAVAVNDRLVDDLDTKLHDGDRVVLLPPVCGG
ncbi:MAG: molybdopterin synthase sulfur carrier subunit [Nitratiruptor sp.]|nr:molybdopterin synthase sulfur carrier subunit [Nitratiruptor sp.]NPA83835.1 MoaD/ThiS family protein [Campylobacterota bacterium]